DAVTRAPQVIARERRYVRRYKPYLRRLVRQYCDRSAAVGKMSDQDGASAEHPGLWKKQPLLPINHMCHAADGVWRRVRRMRRADGGQWPRPGVATLHGAPAVRATAGTMPRRNAAFAGRPPAGAALARVFPATREGSVAACMVIASARHETGAWPVRRTTGTEFRFRYREGGELPARRGQSPPDKGPVRRGVPRTVPATRKQSRGVFCYRQDRVLRGRASRLVITSREPPRPVGPAIDYSE